MYLNASFEIKTLRQRTYNIYQIHRSPEFNIIQVQWPDRQQLDQS
jgi:hypothetical protein